MIDWSLVKPLSLVGEAVSVGGGSDGPAECGPEERGDPALRPRQPRAVARQAARSSVRPKTECASNALTTVDTLNIILQRDTKVLMF